MDFVEFISIRVVEVGWLIDNLFANQLLIEKTNLRDSASQTCIIDQVKDDRARLMLVRDVQFISNAMPDYILPLVSLFLGMKGHTINWHGGNIGRYLPTTCLDGNNSLPSDWWS